jgi:GMP synthase (glutamine-hydrolysing)
VREAGVFSLLVSPTISVAEIRRLAPKGIILSGGPASVFEKGAPTCDRAIFELGIPVLGICYGMQLMSHLLGGHVQSANHREYGRARVDVRDGGDLFAGVDAHATVWMSHGDQVTQVPAGFEVLASTGTCPFAAVRDRSRRFYGVQFHPEVTHTPQGGDMLSNFLFKACGCAGSWKMSDSPAASTARWSRPFLRRRSVANSPASSSTTDSSGRTSATWSRRRSATTSTSIFA